MTTPASADTGSYKIGIGILTAVYTCNFVDRQIVNILAEPIKRDLALSDAQLGLLTGFSFALLYTVLGIPMARWSERSDRSLMISASVAVWSVFTALCGLTTSFVQLLAARVGVGVGEAGCTPPALSLISDSVSPKRRPSAMAIYNSGSFLGALLGLGLGGLIVGSYGWRSAFLFAALPGLVLAPLVRFCLRDPRPRASRQTPAAAEPAASIVEAIAGMMKIRDFRRLTLAGISSSFVSYGMGAFLGSFVLRNHPAQLELLAGRLNLAPFTLLGIALGGVLGVGGMLGVIAGGQIADRLTAREGNGLRIAVIGCSAAFPLYLIGIWSPSLILALVGLFGATFCAAMWIGPYYASLHSLVDSRQRALATSTQLFCSNLIGLGLGPVLIGTISDVVAAHAAVPPGRALALALLLPASALIISATNFRRVRLSTRVQGPEASVAVVS